MSTIVGWRSDILFALSREMGRQRALGGGWGESVHRERERERERGEVASNEGRGVEDHVHGERGPLSYLRGFWFSTCSLCHLFFCQRIPAF